MNRTRIPAVIAPDRAEPAPASRSMSLLILLVGVAFSLLWSSAFIAAKIGLAVAGPLTMLSLRFCLAGAVLAVVLRASGRWTGWPGGATVAAGVLGHAVYLGLAYTGMVAVPAALTAIIVSTVPLLAAVFGAAWLKEALTARLMAGLALSFAGVILIMGRRTMTDGLAPWALVAIAAGAVALAFATLLNRRVIGDGQEPWSMAAAQLLASGALLLPIAAITEGLYFESGIAFWGSLLYQAGPVSVGTTLMMLWLLERAGAARASSFHLLNPFFGLLMAAAVLGERLYPSDWLGLLPLVAGLALALLPRRSG